MLVSWNWLRDYVPLQMSPQEFADRLMMAGLNHESTKPHGSDTVIDLEVTSNRADCLGHLGIARETALLFGQPLTVPEPRIPAGPTATAQAVQPVQVAIDAPALCPYYSARRIRGVRVGPSPAWLVARLDAIGIATINNIVDVTNYVLMECGQPLHAFDFQKLRGSRLVVRAAKSSERLTAIDHKEYALDDSMCVIADAERPVALAGVMGGADSEVSPGTTDVLIEAADFASLSIRSTARKLKLHSPSSYRFERGVDGARIDWASRRCCELILQLAGGELMEGAAVAGRVPDARRPIVLRLGQIPRILGIDVPVERVVQILSGLGCDHLHQPANSQTPSVSVVPPTWRRDLTREIDLIEEVARVHGYDKIPEDTRVPMAASFRTDADRIQNRVRAVLTSSGLDEALTLSLVTRKASELFSPWTDAEALVAETPILEGADHLRRSLIPTLLAARFYNESKQNPSAELFETAKIYLRQPAGLPIEQSTLGIVTGGDFPFAKGLVEAVIAGVRAPLRPQHEPLNEASSIPLLDLNRACRMVVDGQPLAFVGELSPLGYQQTGLRSQTSIAEVNLGMLASYATLIPQHTPLSNFPFVCRDLNLIVDEAVHWGELAVTVRAAAGQLLESLEYKETYRDAGRDGPGKKRLLFSVTLRSNERTLTNEEADQVRTEIVNATSHAHRARLLDS